MTAELLGEGHRKVASQLVERLRRIQDDEEVPRIVLLRGASGAGKSRIIREVYETLRSLQPTNSQGVGYWPPLPQPNHSQVPGRERLPIRKVLGPSVKGFNRPPGTLPSFFWWPVACDQMPDGTLLEVTGSLDNELSAHFPYLVMSFREAVGRGERFRGWLRGEAPKEAKQIGREGGMEAFAAALDAAGIAVPGAGYALATSVRAGKAWRQRRELARGVRFGGGLAIEKSDPAEMMYEQVTRVLCPDLPLVLVIEDLHLMGPSLADLLGYLAQPLAGKPVLVIGSVWPEAASRGTYGDWLCSAEQSVDVIDIPKLSESDLMELARSYAPRTRPESLRIVAQRWTNPYALILFMTDPRVRRAHIQEEELVVTTAELQRFPVSIRGLYERRWEELPDRVRSALMLAAGCLPNERVDGQLWSFQRSVIAEAARASGALDDPAGLVEALGAAVDPFEWSRQRDSSMDLEQFREWVLLAVARSACDDEYGDVDLAAATADVLCQWFELRAQSEGSIFLDPDDPVTLPTAQWLLGLTPAGGHGRGVGIAALVLAGSLAVSHEYRKAVEVLSPDALGMLEVDDGETLRARALLAHWVNLTGNMSVALALREKLLIDQVRVLGREHDQTLANRNSIAVLTADMGDSAGALDLLWDVYRDQWRVLGADHEDTLITRVNIASVRSDLGDTEGALRILEDLLQDQMRVLGPHHAATLATRAGMADAVGQLDDPGGALEMLKALLQDEQIALGFEHPQTLRTRRAVAVWTNQVGDTKTALTMLRALHSDEVRILGPDNPETMYTGELLAVWEADVPGC